MMEIFDWLFSIENRVVFFICSIKLRDIRTAMMGFDQALRILKKDSYIFSPYNAHTLFTKGFLEFVRKKLDIEEISGYSWPDMITQHTDNEVEALRVFYEYLHEYYSIVKLSEDMSTIPRIHRSCNFDDLQPATTFVINCGKCHSILDWRNLMAETLNFPDYYWLGNEWDSLIDCLQADLDWIDTYNVVIVFDGFDEFCGRLDDTEQKQLISSLLFCIDHCHEAKPTCKALKYIVK